MVMSNKTQLILLPNDSRHFKKLYYHAIGKADELYIFTAYLTNWDFEKKLNLKCKKIEIYFGTDFKITKKKAVSDVLKWLPKKHKGCLCAVENIGFHPKLLVWREGNKYFMILGSSNVTTGGFESNIEANLFKEISKSNFKQIIQWLNSNFRYRSKVVNEEWVKKYKEAYYNYKFEKKTKIGSASDVVVNLKTLSKIPSEELKERKLQIKEFYKISRELKKLIYDCANKKMTNLSFWDRMYDLFGRSKARIQGKGFEISGKYANWQQICKSLVEIFEANNENRDEVVRDQIDFLTLKKNSARKAWLTEILSHYYPKLYPIINDPPFKWLKASKYNYPRGSTEGAKYIHISKAFRDYIKKDKIYKNLIELDLAIWSKYG